MRNRLIIGIALIAAPVGPLWAMDVGSFMAKADALEKKGFRALFTSDYKILKAEIVNSSQTLRNERLAAQRAGHRPAYCPLPKSGLKSDEILAAFRTIPAPQRSRIAVKDALRALLARKYSCPA